MIDLTRYPKDSIPHELRCPHNDDKMVVRPWLCYQCSADELWASYQTMNLAYRNGEALVPDKVFDNYEKLCREHYPEDRRFWKVGTGGENVRTDR